MKALLSVKGPGACSGKLSGISYRNKKGQALIACILLFSLAVSAQRTLQEGKSTEDVNSDRIEVTVWAVPAEQKVRPEDEPELSNLVWSGEERKISLAGAGNEHVPFQVVITTSVSGSSRRTDSPGGFFISATNLKSSGGSRISSENVSFYLQHYILIYGKSSPSGDTGYWPDALAPLKVPFDMSSRYHIVRNRPVWVDIFVPSNTPAGIYTGTIEVTKDGVTIETLEVEVEVYSFSLPDETPLITYMNVSRGQLANFYDKPVNSAEIESLTQTYYEYLYANRMEPWFNDMLTPDVAVTGNNVQVSFDDERYKFFMNELKSKRVLLHTFPSNLRSQVSTEPFTNDFTRILHSYLKQVESYFRKNGWENALVFNSPIDEPSGFEEYENTRRWASLVKEATPGVPFLVTRSPLAIDPTWGTLTGYVDNFSVHGNRMNYQEHKRAIQEAKAKGSELTWYVSCNQNYPQPNYFIDAPAMDMVMIPWITARYDMDGILYWALNHWSETVNPWLDPNTFHSGFFCSGGWVLNGEGSLFYPGDQTERFTGQPNVNGPVSSIRFELLRKGIEDHVYLSMLKDLGDKDFADEQVGNMVIDISLFSRKVEDLYNTRRVIARRIEEITLQSRAAVNNH